MTVLRIFIATIAATSLMTAFSYYVSEMQRRLFKEPVLLRKTLTRLHVGRSKKVRQILGWIIHYCIGALFIISYDIVWSTTALDPTWFCGIVFGIISGIIGILGWILIFSLPERPPLTDFKSYYFQLFVAHIIFALTAVAIYKISAGLSTQTWQ